MQQPSSASNGKPVAAQTFGVGIIGVEPNRSWAARAHIPALRALSDRFHLVGLANTSLESGRKAAAAVGIERAFASTDELIASPDVDAVAVTVKVPHHYALVARALDAGKAVYCEWPLGKNLDEALQLDQLARQKSVPAVVGLQALRAPAVRYVKDLVASGFVGEVLSVSLLGTGGVWGAETTQANAYCLDVSSGATLLSIPFGHTVAAVESIFGRVEKVSAELAVRRRTVKIIETGEEHPLTAPDQLLVAGVLQGGAPLSVHYRGGTFAGTGLLLEINGTAGNLQITGPMGHLQLAPLSVHGAQGINEALQPLPVPEQYSNVAGLVGPAANVASIYEGLYTGLTGGVHQAPTFGDAVRIHRLLDAIETAAATGQRQTLAA